MIIRSLFLISILIFIPIFIFTFQEVSEYYTHDNILLIVLGTAGIVLLVAFFLSMRKISTTLYIVILLFIAFLLRLCWVLNIDSEIISDFEVMYNAARRAAEGDFGFTSEGIYFMRWGYQLGFTMYQALIIYIFGDSTFFLKLFNILYSVGTSFLIYLIGKKLFNETSGRTAGFLYAVSIPNIVMTSILTNQYLAIFLFYFAFYLLISDFYEKKYSWLAIGLFLALGDIIRPLGSFILLAVGLYLFIAYMLQSNKLQKLATVKKFTGIIVTFYLVHYVFNFAFVSTGVTPYSLENREPLWKFVTGLNHETIGVFSDADASYLSQFPVGEERDIASKELIKDRIADKSELITLFKEKFIYMWTSHDGSIIWGLRSGEHDYTNLKESLTKIERVIYIISTLFIIIGLIRLLFNRKVNLTVSLFLLLIIGYVCVHLLIEIQTRYRFFIIPSFTLIQGLGIYTILEFSKKIMTYFPTTYTQRKSV